MYDLLCVGYDMSNVFAHMSITYISVGGATISVQRLSTLSPQRRVFHGARHGAQERHEVDQQGHEFLRSALIRHVWNMIGRSRMRRVIRRTIRRGMRHARATIEPAQAKPKVQAKAKAKPKV